MCFWIVNRLRVDVMTAVDADNTQLGITVLQLLGGASSTPLPRHRHELSRDDVRATQQARILAAAIGLFAENGYANTTVLQIAKQAGVSRKTFYELYDTKEDVFLDTYRAVEVLVTVAPATGTLQDAALGDWRTELPALVERMLAVLALAPAATRMFFLEALGAGPRVRARRNEAIAEFVAALMPTLGRLRATIEPALPPLDDQLGYAIAAASIELIVQHLGRS